MLKKILIVLLLIVVLIACFFWYMGFFGTYPVSEKQTGPYIIAYKDYIGDYKNSGNIINEVYSALKGVSLEAKEGFGLYYDDPKSTPTAKLRSRLGCIIEQKYLIKTIKLPKDIKLATLKKQNSMVVEFPLKNNISYILGIFKAYPALSKHMDEKNYKMAPAMELYDMPNHKIDYIIEIIK